MISPDSGSPSEFAETIRKIFSPDGLLSEAKSFEYRPEQQEMAVAVAEALAERKHLVVEAGTGVGKSLAYLIPAILWAKQQNRKAVVSTHTINLQEQLIFKDIPIVRKVLAEVAGDFSAILWKGRANYVCPTRLERAMSQAGELFTSTETEELKRIWEWAQTTDDGSLSDLAVEADSHVWSLVCSEPHICTPKTCGNNPRCHYQRVRKQLVSADLVVMNHTLFFLSLGGIAEQDKDESGLSQFREPDLNSPELYVIRFEQTGLAESGVRRVKSFWNGLACRIATHIDLCQLCPVLVCSHESQPCFLDGKSPKQAEIIIGTGS